jgi:hypothetical protein
MTTKREAAERASSHIYTVSRRIAHNKTQSRHCKSTSKPYATGKVKTTTPKMLQLLLSAVLFLTLPFSTLSSPLLDTRQQGSCATTPCAPGLCCSQFNFCGVGPEYCQTGSCVGGVGGTCAPGSCCSPFGYCGVGPSFCGTTPPPTSSSSSAPPPPSSSAPPPPTATCANQWNQCGGEGWNGAKCCKPPFTCQYGGVWYSQCV